MSGPRIIGHRGTGISGKNSENVENSIEGFRSALLAGADGVELDVQLSADGEAVVHHDSKLGRVTQVDDIDGKRSISQLRSDELSDVKLLGDEGAVIPTLPQVLHDIHDELDGRELWVELKSQRNYVEGKKLVERVVEVLSADRIWPRTWLLSFDQEMLKTASELASDAKLLLIAMLRVRRSIQIATVNRFEGVGIYHRFAAGPLIRMARRGELTIATGILDTEKQIRRFLGQDVDLIFTDLPELACSLRQALK